MDTTAYKLSPSADTSIRIALDHILGTPGPDLVDRIVAEFAIVAGDAAHAAALETQCRFIAPPRAGESLTVGRLNVRALAAEVLETIPARDLRKSEAIDLLASTIAKAMTMRRDAVVAMLWEERDRLANVANLIGAQHPMAGTGIAAQVATLDHVVALIEHDMLPAQLVPVGDGDAS